MAIDAPRATAVANADLQSGADRRAYMETVALCACRFQDDPHNQKITISTFEEYGHNSTHLKDRLLLATPRRLAGWVKMPGEPDCSARFEKEWISNQALPRRRTRPANSGPDATAAKRRCAVTHRPPWRSAT